MRLTAGMPRGYRLIDLHDAWVGAPALATELVAADYRVTVLGAETGRLRSAAEALFRAESLPRERRREKKVTAYDLRPLLLALEVREAPAQAGAPAADIWMRLRHSQDLGSGRPEEVVAALADELGLAVLDSAQAEADPPGREGGGGQEDGGRTPQPCARPGPPGPAGARPARPRTTLAGGRGLG